MIKKIMIVGIGGVGGYIAGKMLNTLKDKEITLIARGEQLKAIKENGLKIIDEDDEFTVYPKSLTDNPEKLGEYDLIIFATKSYDLGSALKLVGKNVSEKTVLLPLLNGVEHDKEIKKFFKNATVLNGCIYILSYIVKPGVIKKYGGVFSLMFGQKSDNLEKFNPIKDIFDKAGLVNKLTKSIEFETWRKFLLISSYASINSYYDKPTGWIVQNRLEELKKLLWEIKEVANKKGVSLNEKNIENILDKAQKIPYNSKMSMQLDFEKGRKTEIETLCGYIVREGEKVGVSTPLMKKIYNKLSKI